MNILDKLFGWYFKRAALPYWCMLLLDSVIVFLSGVFIFYLFHRGYQTMLHFAVLSQQLLVYLVFSLLSFRIFHTYAGIIRYSSFVDLQKIGMANFLAMLLSCGAQRLMVKIPDFISLSMLQTAAMYVLATVLMWAVRVLVKMLYETTTSDRKALRVLIYGAMSGGVGLAKNIRSQKPTRFVLKGFITQDKRLRHNLLMGEKVYTVDEDLEKIIRDKDIEAILVSPLRVKDFRNDQKTQDAILSAGCKIFMASLAKEWDESGDVANYEGMQLHEVSVEDLLPRDEIKVDMDSVGKELTDRRILITGAAGSIGSEMVRQVAVYHPAAMMLIDQAETPEHDIRLMMQREYPSIAAQTVVTSICKKDRMEQIFRDFRPDYVFHAAAYKHVPMMEDNPSEAVQNNVYGTKVIADLSVKYGVKKFVMVSTDKAVNPTNVMGCSKRICEIYTQSLNKRLATLAAGKDSASKATQFVTTRFGNVLGSNGSVIPLFKEQIKKGGPVTVTHPDIIRFFMLIPEACKLVLEAGTKGHGGEIFVFDMGQPVKIADLARRMIKLSGAKNVEIKFTGLRAGEKLYEEVLNELEGTKPSFHDKIRIAEVREYDYDQVSKDIDELIEVSKQYNDMATVKKMKEIVPEYKSNNSIYEQLDK
ncbi:MAG: polysaccharide biosynthesis protein [Prevotella sp.]|nr:polysaccharide biosynthesis protein [Prevotella sp.]